MAALRAMTADELLPYSHEPYRTELIGGRLVEMEPAGALHGVLAARICQRRLVTVHRPDADIERYSGPQRLDLDDVLPGFAPSVDELFA